MKEGFAIVAGIVIGAPLAMFALIYMMVPGMILASRLIDHAAQWAKTVPL